MSPSAGRGRTALITGCSSGIGRATALRLDAAGWRVLAGVRKQADADSLAAAGSERLEPLILDIADSDSIEAARERLDETLGSGLDALVNNAGTTYGGPLEFVPLEDLRHQLEVNLVGHVAMTQAALPHLRSARGRIVNVTSIGGIVATPFLGPYCAAKFGLEALSDCLRVELRPWGIKTIAIEPGSVATEIWENTVERMALLRKGLAPRAEELYSDAMDSMVKGAIETGERGMPPDRAAKAVERALTVRRPRPRYLIGSDAHGMASASRLLPARAYDRLLARFLRLP